jgi:hypothetical protein
MSSRIKLKGAAAIAEAPRFAHLTFAAVVLASSLLLSACNTAEVSARMSARPGRKWKTRPTELLASWRRERGAAPRLLHRC